MLVRPGRLLTRWNTVDGLSIQPVAYWNLDEESGTRVDSIGSLDLTDNNTVGSADGVGPGQTAAAFVRANDKYLSHLDDDILSPANRDWNACGWLYLDDVANSYQAAGKTTGEYDLLINTSGNIFFRARNAGDTALNTVGLGNGTIVAETWAFIEFGYNATTEEIFISKNAGTRATVSATGGVFETTGAFQIGRNNANAINGRWQSFGIFHGLLTDADRAFLYNDGNAARLASEL